MPSNPEPTDAELIAMVRSGQRQAYDLLYERHRAAASWVARHYARDPSCAEDLVAESFTRVLAAIVRGEGPAEAFRPYLYTVLRRTAFDWGNGQLRVRPMDVVSQLEARGAQPDGWYLDPAEEILERELVARAFDALPERWRMVLWHLEVEDESPAQIGPLLGLSAAAVSALAYRAREGLRQAYLQAHLAQTADPACRPHAGRMGAYVRNGLGARATTALRRHLDSCASCSALHAELTRLNDSLGSLIAPLVFGAAAVKVIASATAASKKPFWNLRSMASRTMYATTTGLGAVTCLGMTIAPSHSTDVAPFAVSPSSASSQSDSSTTVTIANTPAPQRDTIPVAPPKPAPDTTLTPSPTGPSQVAPTTTTGCHPAATCQEQGPASTPTAPRILALPPILIPFELAWKLLSLHTVTLLKTPAIAAPSVPSALAPLHQLPPLAAPLQSAAPAQLPTTVATQAPLPNTDPPATAIPSTQPATTAPQTPPSPNAPSPDKSPTAAPSPTVAPPAVTPPSVAPSLPRLP